MRKYFVTVILVLAAVWMASSQITITKLDMPQPGDTIRLSTTTDTIGLPQFSLTGANYTWDYSKLVPMSQTIDTFLSVSSTPLAYQLYFNDVIFYPAYVATVAQSVPNPIAINPVTITNQINYYKATSSAYENVGFGANINGLPTSVKEDNIDFIYVFPMNYGNVDSSNSSYHVNIPGIGYYGTKQRRINYVDGWGTLKTPYGSFQVLRVATYLFVTDTLYVSSFNFGTSLPLPEQLQYKFLALGKSLPILQVNETIIGAFPAFSSIVYRDSVRSGLGFAQISAPLKGVKLFPNPAQNSISIVSQNDLPATQLNIYNSMGQSIMQKHLDKLISGNPYIVDISSFTPGVYYLKLCLQGGSVTYKIVKH